MNKSIYAFLVFIICINNALSQQPYFFYQNPFPTGDNINDIKFFKSNICFACGNNGLMMKSTNDGFNWSIVPIGSGNSFKSICVIDSLKGYICGTNGLLLRTVNSGVTWDPVGINTLMDLNCIYFADEMTGFISADSGLVFRTNNGGSNWIRLYTGTMTNLHAIKFRNVDTGFAVGNLGIIIGTTNSGYSWIQRYSNNLDTLTELDLKDAASLKVSGWHYYYTPLGYMRSGVYIRSLNSGLNWSIVTNTSPIQSFVFLDSNTGFAFGDNIIKTTDAGSTWVNIMPDSLTGFGGNKIYVYDSTTVFCVSNTGIILSSTNCGSSWFKHEPISYLTKDLFEGVCFINENTGMVVGGGSVSYYSQVLMRTTNGGNNWVFVQTPSNNMYMNCIKMINQNTGFIGAGNSYLYKTTNGGINWTQSYCETISGIWDMYFFDVNSGMAVGGQMGTTRIRYTSDGGVNWENRSGGLPYWAFGLDFTDDYTGYASCQSGVVLKTTNRGLNWSVINTGTSDMLNDIGFANETTGYVATLQGRILKTTNAGINWTQTASFGSSMYRIKVFNPLTAATVSFGFIIYTQDGGASWIRKRISDHQLFDLFFLNSNTGFVVGWDGTILKTTSGGIVWANEHNQNVPGNYSLEQNFPNPFNPVTTIIFSIPKTSDIKIAVYDVTGKEVDLILDKRLSADTYQTGWDGTKFSSGIYFYRLTAGDFSISRKMILVK